MIARTQAKALALVLSVAGMSALSAVVAFAVNILSARTLGPELRGDVALALQLAYLLSAFVGFGTDRALLRGGSEDSQAAIPRLWMIMAMAAILAGLLYPLYGHYAVLAGSVALVTVLLALNRASAINRRQLQSFYLCTGLYQLSIILLALCLMWSGTAASLCWTAIYIFPGIILAIIGWRTVTRSTPPLGNNPLAVASRNRAFMASALGELTTTRFVRVILPLQLNSAALGLFIVVATATEPLYWVGKSLADFASRRSGAAMRTPRSVARRIAVSCGCFLLLGIVGGWLLYHLLVPLFGVSFAPAQVLVLPLTCAAVLLASQRYVVGMVLSSDRPSRTGWIDGTTAVLSLIVFPIAIHLYGLSGAAWGCVLVYGCGLLFAVAGLVAPARTRKHQHPTPTPSRES